MSLLLAEDLLLLLLDDESGRALADGTKTTAALGGAMLLDLTLAGRVDETSETGMMRRGRIVVTDPGPTGDDELDRALEHVGRAEKKPAALVQPLGKGLQERLADRLVARGIVRREERKVLGLFPMRSWPAEDSSHEDAVRRELSSALTSTQPPAPRTAALISLLHAIDTLPKVVEGDRRQLKRRAKEISEGDWASKGVKSAVESVNAAVMVAVVAGGSAAAAGSS